MKYYIIYRANQLVECAVAALAEVILDSVETRAGWDKIEGIETIHNATVILLGTYWSKQDIETLSHQQNHMMFYDYSSQPDTGYNDNFMNNLTLNRTNATQTLKVYKQHPSYDGNGLGPLMCFVQYLTDKHALSNAASALIRREQKLMLELDAYSLKQHKPEVEALITGIYSSEQDQTGTKPVLRRIFEGELKRKALLKRGVIIHANNTKLAQQTALKNSKIITLHDGTPAWITVTAPHFIRLTGEALLNRGNAEVAIVQRICLDNTKPDAVAYTLMSRNSGIDVTTYVSPYGGGGSPGLSGVTIEQPFTPPPFCQPPPEK